MTRPLLLDLFCGAGGCAMGYHRAGFDVIGIDNRPQPNYPFPFIQADALNPPVDLRAFDAIHTSPPCQFATTASGRARKAGTQYLNLISDTRHMLEAAGVPYVIENVEHARRHLHNPVRLCGSSFGLDLRRHRLFESNMAILTPPCDHSWQTPRFQSLDSRMAKAGRLASVVGVHGHCNYAGELELRKAAMGIDWMTSDELSQSIPPAYTEHIGRQLVDHLERQEVAA